MKLHDDEIVIHDSSDDPVHLTDFEAERMAHPEEILEVDFSVSRDWEPEETGKGVTINTTPDPTLKLYETANGTVILFCVKLPGALVHTAVLAGHDETRALLTRGVQSVEDNFDGIRTASGRSYCPRGDDLLDHIYDCVDDVTPDDE